jgi:hypothetical protein
MASPGSRERKPILRDSIKLFLRHYHEIIIFCHPPCLSPSQMLFFLCLFSSSVLHSVFPLLLLSYPEFIYIYPSQFLIVAIFLPSSHHLFQLNIIVLVILFWTIACNPFYLHHLLSTSSQPPHFLLSILFSFLFKFISPLPPLRDQPIPNDNLSKD